MQTKISRQVGEGSAVFGLRKGFGAARPASPSRPSPQSIQHVLACACYLTLSPVRAACNTHSPYTTPVNARVVPKLTIQTKARRTKYKHARKRKQPVGKSASRCARNKSRNRQRRAEASTPLLLLHYYYTRSNVAWRATVLSWIL